MAETTNSAGQPVVTALYRYPVKGLTPEAMQQVSLSAGETMPFDRAFAIENGVSRFDADAPRHLPKIAFLMLMRDERVATLETLFDDATTILTIKRDGRQVARGNLRTPIGRQMIEQFMAAYMKGSLRGAPKVLHVAGHSFSDVSAKCLHIVNAASLRDLERLTGRSIDPLRFRANVYVDGVPAWSELAWVGRAVQMGGLGLKVFKRTQRCDATNVDPKTAARDMAIPAELQRAFGHSDFGVYATVQEGGAIAVGDPISPPA